MMRTISLIIAFITLNSVVNAETIIGLVTDNDLKKAGLYSSSAELPGGTIIVDNEAGSFGVAYDDQWSTTIS